MQKYLDSYKLKKLLGINGQLGKDGQQGEHGLSRLTFQNGKFLLTGKATLKAVNKDKDSWDVIAEGCVTLDYKAAARFRQLADKRALRILDRAFVKRFPAPSSPLPPFLDPHQIDGVRWVLTRSRSYLAHAPGAGKTCQAIVAALLTTDPGQVVYVVPPSLTVNWAREITKFFGQFYAEDVNRWASVSIIPETERQWNAGWDAEFVIVPDSMLSKDWVFTKLIQMKKRFVAVDEASRFKEPMAIRTRVLFGGKLPDGRISPGLVHDARHAVLLDGSPMPNRPMELWAPTYAMSPESIDFMSQQDFGFRYCGAVMNERGNWEFKHSAREDELRERLQDSFMHVVTEDQLSHPERRRSMLIMTGDPRSPEQRAWEKKSLQLLKLDEIDEEMSQGELAHFRAELGVRKVPWVADYVANRLKERDESILVFAWHREVAFELERRLRKFNPGVVIGGTSDNSREGIFTSFQDGSRKLIIGNITAMGRGHNLQRADRVVFAEYSWTDELNKQCEKRASRKGSNKSFVRCDYIVAPNSMDETILQAVFRKSERVKRIIG